MLKIEQQLQHHYNFLIKSIYPINDGRVNNVWLISTDNNEYILKKYTTTNYEDLNYEINIIQHLTKKNFPTPNIIKNSSQEYFFTFGNKFYVLFKKLDQSPARPPFNYYVDLYKLFCQCQYGINLESRPSWLPIYNCAWIKHKGYEKQYPQLFSMLDYYEKNLKTIYNQLPKIIIHGDLKKENIIPTKNGLCLIDFGNARYEARSLDMVHLADSLAKENGIISIDIFLENLALIHKQFKINKIEKTSLLWILIIHKITEVVFYSKNDSTKVKNIIHEILILHENINYISNKILKF